MDENNGSLGNQPSPVNTGDAIPTPAGPAMPSTPDEVTVNTPVPEAPVAPDVPSTPGVIASTPEVAPPPSDDEIAKASANLTPSRPFFSDHPTQTTASGTGDIILEKTKTPGSKKPLIIALIIGAVVLMVGIVILLMVNRPVSQEELAQSFSEYRDLLENGPADFKAGTTANTMEDNADAGPTSTEPTEEFQGWDDYDYYDEDDEDYYDDEPEEDDSDNDIEDDEEGVTYNEGEVEEIEYEHPAYADWFIFSLGTKHLSDEDEKAYFDSVLTGYNNFTKLISRAKSSDYKWLQDNVLPSYLELLETTIAVSSRNVAVNELERQYLNNGTEAAKEYISDFTVIENNSAFIETTLDSLRNDLLIQLQLLELYSQYQCIEGDSVDYSCNLIGNQKYDQLIAERDSNIETLDIWINGTQGSFYAQTLQISNTLMGEDSNAQ